MTLPILSTSGLGKRFGGFAALDGVELSVAAGERVGLIGPNGSGKSTFVNCLAGGFPSYQGEVAFEGRRLEGLAPHIRTRRGLARTFQLPRPFQSLDVLQNVAVPVNRRAILTP